LLKYECPRCGLILEHRSIRSFQNIAFEGYTFSVVLLEPAFGGVGIRKELNVVGVANLLAGFDLDKNCHWFLFS
jgi:hypothetical protein